MTFLFSSGGGVTTGTGAPSSTPSAVGDRYYDTTNKDWYEAVGTASSADWQFAQGTTFTSGEVSGGAVTTVSTGTIPALIDGAEYLFCAKIKAAGTSVLRFFINGDTTLTNYRRGFISSNGSALDSSTTLSCAVNAIGDMSTISGRIRVVNSRVHMEAVSLSYISSGRCLSQTSYHISETNVTSIQVTSDTASHIDNGSEIWLRRIK